MMHAWTQHRVRGAEYKPNLSTEAPSADVISWHIVHIRDDLAGLSGALTITNGLLAALLAQAIL